MADTHTVVDWKTTQRAWSEKTAERYVFQRAIYTQATFEIAHEPVRFLFVPLGAFPGGQVQIIDATPEPTDVFRVLETVREIAVAIESGKFGCTCKGKLCQPEQAA